MSDWLSDDKRLKLQLEIARSQPSSDIELQITALLRNGEPEDDGYPAQLLAGYRRILKSRELLQ